MDLKDIPHSAGKTFLEKYAGGGSLSARQSIIAKCCDCMGYHVDGRIDCKLNRCPLYPFMPYREGEKMKRKGPRVLSEDHKKKLVEGRRKKGQVRG